MKGIFYQLKNIRRDKMCILSFLLPIILGIAITLMSDVSFSAVGDTIFGIIQNNLTPEMESWLEDNGRVEVYTDIDLLVEGVNDPATQMIGVLRDGDSLSTLLTGDELKLYKDVGNNLPQLYAARHIVEEIPVQVQPVERDNELLKSLLIVITMVTAMFMGCTYNAMNIIGEKEDGIAYINEVLPMTKWQYIKQKIVLGLAGGILSTAITAVICIRIELRYVPVLLLFIILSAFISALAGLFIGKVSNGLMVGIVYIKLVMILFIAPPILFYLIAPAGGLFRRLTYLLPSSVTFYGLMDLFGGAMDNILEYLLVLLLQSVVWSLLYLAIGKGFFRKKSRY